MLEEEEKRRSFFFFFFLSFLSETRTHNGHLVHKKENVFSSSKLQRERKEDEQLDFTFLFIFVMYSCQ